MKARFTGLVVLGMIWSLGAGAQSTLHKSFDGQIAACPSEKAENETKLFFLSLQKEQLNIRSAICIDGQLKQDGLPSERSYVTEQGVVVTESFSDYKLVVRAEGSTSVAMALKDYELSGNLDINLDDLKLPEGKTIEVFVTARKKVQASNGLNIDAGRIAWGSYLLKR